MKCKLCDRCKKNESTEQCECPYQREIENEIQECNCCEECQKDCLESI